MSKSLSYSTLTLIALSILSLAGLAALLVGLAAAQEESPYASVGSAAFFFPPYPSANERFGVGVAGGLSGYDVSPLHAGWYINWGTSANPAHPDGWEYAQIIRLKSDRHNTDPSQVRISPSRDVIAQIAARNPGAMWFIGNEPDRIIYMDDVRPEVYAVVYHDLYYFIKGIDPTAKVGIGGVVQPTPCRLLYLDIIWDTYQSIYGERLPTDVWNVHNFVLNEKPGSWGCDIPSGLSSCGTAAEPKCCGDGREAPIQVRLIKDNDNMDLFRQQIYDFRQWMAEKGERDKPLIITEYGCLMPDWIVDEDGRSFNYPRIRDFMLATFDFFLYATDPNTGYPADGNHLVQAWAWYSLNDPYYNGQLYNNNTKQIGPLGEDFANYITSNSLITPYVDLMPVPTFTATVEPVYVGQPVTLTVTAEVLNRGNQEAQNVVVRFYDAPPAQGGQPIGGDQVITTLPTRYQGSAWVQTTWATVVTENLTVYVMVDPEDAIAEPREDNNLAQVRVAVYADLFPGPISYTPAYPLLSDGEITITVSVPITNAGPVAVENVRVRFWDGPPGLPGSLNWDKVIPVLMGGESRVVTMTWAVPFSETHQVYVQVDPDHAVAELSEDNNESSTALLFTADLAPAALYTDPPAPYTISEPITITLTTVVTQGGNVVLPDVRVRFWVSYTTGSGTAGTPGTLAWERVIPHVTPSEPATATITWTVSLSGVYQVFVQADSDDAFPETVEGNNIRSWPVLVAGYRAFMPVIYRNW